MGAGTPVLWLNGMSSGNPQKGNPSLLHTSHPVPPSSPERTPGISQGTTAGYDFCKVPARSRRWESAGGVRLFG